VEESINNHWIFTGFIHNFAKTKFSGLYIRYDYGSIMHYGKFAFTRNGQPTIMPTVNIIIIIIYLAINFIQKFKIYILYYIYMIFRIVA
jgi:hypothetical protein